MDNRVHSRLLSVMAFSAVIQCAQWIISHMALQHQGGSQLRKPKAQWTNDEEVAFINYLPEHQSEAACGCFKGATIAAAIQSIASLHVKGLLKNKSSGMNKWNLVSFNLIFIFQSIANYCLYTVEAVVQCNQGVQNNGLQCNLE